MSVWSLERIERVKKWWLAGYSATSIARMEGHGITRNMIMGKVHRMGLPRMDGLPRKPIPPKPKRPIDPDKQFNPLPASKKDPFAVKTMRRIKLRTGSFDSFDPEPRLGRRVPTARIQDLAAHFM